MRAIALRAGVTQGLIRHYFDTKEDLIAAAHEHLMTGLTEASAASLDALPADPLARLADFVANAVSPPVVDRPHHGAVGSLDAAGCARPDNAPRA